MPKEITAADAIRAGVLYLVDEDGNRLTGTPEEQLLAGQCWAHLRDGATGEWYVHPFKQAAYLNDPSILSIVLPFPESNNENA